MKTKAMKGLSRRILTLVLALIMALGSLSGAVSAVALADDEEVIGSEAPGTETGTGEEEPGEEPEPAPETEPEPEPEPEEDEEPKWEYPEEGEGPVKEEEPSEYALNVSLIVSDEAELCLKTEDSVVSKEVTPAIRLWDSEESLRYSTFAQTLEGEEIVIAGAVYDAATGEPGISFTEKTKVTVTGKSVGEGEYVIYIEEGEGLKAVEVERRGNALCFEAEGVSLFVVTKKTADEPIEEPVEEPSESEEVNYEELFEVEESEDEPLLDTDELSDETLEAIGIERDGKTKDPKEVKTDDGILAREGTVVTEDDRLPWQSTDLIIEDLTIKWVPVRYNQPVDPVHLDLECTTDTVDDQKFEIVMRIVGGESIAPGRIEIVFPAFLWKDRNGEEAGKLSIGLPKGFEWKRIADSVVITNTRSVDGTATVKLQAAFRGVKAHDMIDGTDSRTYNDFFNVQANISLEDETVLIRYGNQEFNRNGTPKTEEVDEEEVYVYEPIYATIDTRAYVTSVTKSAGNQYTGNKEYFVYYAAPEAIPEEYLPENPDDYVYVRWSISATPAGNQPFKLELIDEIPAEDAAKYGARILLAQGLNPEFNGGSEIALPSEDGMSLTCVLYDGYNATVKSAIVWTIYDKSKFEEGFEYYVGNTATAKITGWDDQWDGDVENVDWENNVMLREGRDYNVTGETEDGEPVREAAIVKTKSASAKARIKAPVTYTVTKIWNDNDNEEGHRPDSQKIVLYRDGTKWMELYLSEANEWTYSWSDGGQPHTYGVDEFGFAKGETRVNYNPGDEGYNPVEGMEGQPYQDYSEWYYDKESKEYNADTHTWTFTNKYNVSYRRFYVIPFMFPDPSKVSVTKTQPKYTKATKTDTSDHILNDLQRGNTVLIPYKLSLDSDIQRMTYWNDGHPWEEDGIGDYRENIFDPTKYGQREIKVELEDYNVSVKDMVNGGSEQQTLGIGDYDIAKVTLTQPTIYVWTQPTVDENGERIVDIYSPWDFAEDEEASASTPLTLYGRSLDENGEWGEWIAYAVLQNGEVTVSEGAETNTREVTKKNASGVWEFVRYEYDVTLPVGVHQVKTSVVSKKSRVQMGYEVSVRLYPNGPIVKDTVERAVAADSEETYAWVSLVNDSRGYATIDTSMNASYEGTEEIAALEGNDSNKVDESSAVGQLHGRSFKNAVSLDKSYEYYEPEEGSNESTPYKLDAENGRMEFTNKVVLTLQSNVPYDLKDEYDKLINEGTLPNTQSGTFYELLPEGVSLDETSIKIDGGSGVIEDVYTIENYMFSGRTLVVVKAAFTKSNTEYISNSYHYANGRQTTLDAISRANRAKDSINYPASGWMSRHTLTYVSYLPYDEAFSRAVNGMIPPLVNAVVYEADEEALATVSGWRGEPDDPAAGNNVRSLLEIAPENRRFDLTELTTNLDGAREDPSFVYATAYLDITQGLFGVLLQGQKHVSKDGMSWESGTTIDARVTVYEGTTYVYRINKVVTKGDKQCNIIFYDPLEIAEADEHGAWQGTFESVDVSALRELGIVPVVYYYTGTAALPTEFASLANDLNYKTGAGWSTELPSDPSTVKAIVVDASKDANGNAVVIEASEEEDSYVPIYIHMRAPLGEEPFANSEDRMDAEKNAHAFNKAFTYCESAGEGKEGAVYGWFHTSSTMVGILPYSVSVTKAWNDHDDNDGVRPESITVSLYGNGVLVSTKTVTPDEDGNWYVEFPHVRRFDDKSVPVTYTVVETNIDGYEASVELTSSTEAMQSFKITNSHEDELTSIPFTKIWDIPDGEDDGEDRPTALVMHLYRWVETTTVDAETGEETTTGEWVDTGAMKYLRAGDNDAVWSGSFDNLKKYENHGKEIIYTVREEVIERYITSYEEYTPGDADEDNKNAPEITNRYYPYSDIVITKTVVNATAKALEGENGVFTFNLALTYKGEAVVQYFDYEKTLADGTVETGKILGVSEFTLRDGESLRILKVRADTQYEITENDKAGYTLISASGTTGTVKTGVTSEAKFTNHYESSGYATLEARKELTGRALAGYQFRFELKNADGEVIGTAYNSASSDSTVEGGTATVYLPNLNYTEADDGAVYYYTVSETVPDPLPGGYTYDNTVYTVKVSVADNGNGTLTIEVEYVDLPEGETEPVFKNEYHAEGALGLKAWKALKGGSLADYEDVFEFEIVDENGERVGETATNDAEGVILFDEIEYTEKDVGKTYLYVIREINTEDERVIYDEDVFGYLVTVYDNGNGTLNFQQKIVAVKLEEGKYVADEEAEMPEPVFRNKLTSGSLAITKNISWADSIQDEDTIAALREKEFTFKIRFYGEEVPEDVTVEKTNAAGGGSAPTGGVVSAMAGSVAIDAAALETAAAKPGNQAGTNSSATSADGTIVANYDETATKLTISGTGTIDGQALKTLLNSVVDKTKCKTIVTTGNITITGSMDSLFGEYSASYTVLETADLSALNTSTVTSMNSLFSYCSALTSLNLSNFNTAKVTGMVYMFYGCSALTSLDLSNFNTSKVTSTYGMFLDCSGLTSINVSSFDTSQVTNMEQMFRNCSSITSLDVSNFNTSNVDHMSHMFADCKSLIELDLSNFDTSKVVYMMGVFSGCTSLEKLDISGFNTSRVSAAGSQGRFGLSYFFKNCNALSEVKLGANFKFMIGSVANYHTQLPDALWTNSDKPELGIRSSQVIKSNYSANYSGTWVRYSENFIVYDLSTYTVTINGNLKIDGISLYNAIDYELSSKGSNRENKNVKAIVTDGHIIVTENTSSLFSSFSSVTSIDLKGLDTSSVTNMSYMFSGCYGLTSLDVTNFDTSSVTNMNGMFWNCYGLTSLDVSGLDTSSVTKMSTMFGNCYGLTSLDVTNFDTSSVTNMNGMFDNCSGLTSLDVTNFNTSAVTDMSFMFRNCHGLTSLDVTKFDTSKVTNMGYMFADCYGLYSLDISDFDTSSVTSMSNMFSHCHGLTSLDVSALDTSKVTFMSYMFSGCYGLTSLDVSALDTSKVTTMKNMFSGCLGLTSLDVSSFNTGNVSDMSYMFYGCYGLTSLDVSGLNTSKVTTMYQLFYNCKKLTSLDLSSLNTSSVTNMDGMFTLCNALVEVKLGDSFSFKGKNITSTSYMAVLPTGLWSKVEDPDLGYYSETELRNETDAEILEGTWRYFSIVTYDDGVLSIAHVDKELTVSQLQTMIYYEFNLKGVSMSNVTKVIAERTRSADGVKLTGSAESLFSNYTAATEMDLSSLDVSGVTNMGNMFFNCQKLTSLDISGWDTSSVTNMYSMFRNCPKLMSLDVSSFNTSSVTNMSSLFWGCKNLESLNLSGWNTDNVTDMGYMFSGCYGLTSLDLSGWNTEKVTNMSHMFSGCNGLTSLDLSSYNTSKVTNMGYMFTGCIGLTNLDLSNFDTGSVTSMVEMFYNCSNLKTLDISGFSTKKVTSREMYSAFGLCGMFDKCTALEEITLGEDFSFRGGVIKYRDNYALLPPTMWKHSTNTSIPHYSNTGLQSNYDGATMAGTWVLITDYTVIFTSEYPNAVLFAQSATYKEKEASPTLPEAYLPGYRFLGWVNRSDYSSYFYPAQTSIPANTYVGDTTVTLVAQFEYVGDGPQEDDENTYTFTLKGGETATISDLPAGVKYEIWELTEEGWVLVEKTGDAGEIVPEATQTATFTNRYDPSATQAEITVTKLLDGEAAEAGAFSFTLSLKSGPDGVEQEPITLNNGGAGKVTFGPIVYSVEGPYVYEIRENAEDSGKFSCDTHVETVKVYVVANAASGGLDAVVEYDTDGAFFNNYTLPGTLTVTKAVTDDEITQANKDGKEFTFTVTLTDKYDRPLTSGFAMSASGDLIPTLVYPNGRTESITSGSVTFTLKAGETATIRNLPEGAQYRVEETELPGGWSAEGSKSKSGAITAGGSAEVTITNKYSTGSVSSAHVSFDAYKELVGAQLTAGAYEFELYEISGPDMEEGEAAKLIETVTNDGLIENEDDEYYNKYGTVSFSEIEYGRLYGTADEYVYEIREKAGTDPTMQYSDNVLRYKVTVRDNGEGRLVTEVAHESGNEVFTNALLTGSLKVTKTVANATALAADKEFTFTLTIVDAAGIELSDSYDLRVYDAEGGLKTEGTIRSGGTVTLKGGESFVVLGLPHEAKYSVVEAETKGFRTSVTAEEKNDAERKGGGAITAGKESTVGFVNTYSSIGSAEASLRKVFVGGQITTGAFKFELREAVTETDDEGNAILVPGDVIDTAYAATDGTIGFSALDFTAEDDGKTFTYFITEVDMGDEEVKYDPEPMLIYVEVHDNGEGEMIATVRYDESDDRNGVFTNYAMSGLTITKQAFGAVADGEFEFTITLKDENGEAYAPDPTPAGWTAVEGETGVYTFKLKNGESTSVKLRAGSYYKIVEETGKYLTSWTVNSRGVETTGAGGIVERTLNGTEDVIFKNSQFKLEIAKELTAATEDEVSTEEFTFNVRFELNGEVYELATLPEGWSAVEGESGVYTFKLKSGEKTSANVAYGVKYSVTELNPDGNYITSYVISNEEGEIVSFESDTAERTIGGSGNESVLFKNHKLYELEIAKRVDANDTTGTFTFEISFEFNGEAYDPEVPEGWRKLESGKYEFTLKNGESTKVRLPYGATYKVSEEESVKYRVSILINGDEVEDDGLEYESGELNANENVTFVNYGGVAVTVKKLVEGSLGDRTRTFTFRLKVSYEGSARALPEVPEGFEKVGEGEYEFKLAHGQSVTFQIIKGMDYEITETDGEKYLTRNVIGDGEWTEGKTAKSESVSSNETVTFENTYDSDVPTGVSVGMGGAALLTLSLIGTAGFLFIKKRKQEE